MKLLRKISHNLVALTSLPSTEKINDNNLIRSKSRAITTNKYFYQFGLLWPDGANLANNQQETQSKRNVAIILVLALNTIRFSICFFIKKTQIAIYFGDFTRFFGGFHLYILAPCVLVGILSTYTAIIFYQSRANISWLKVFAMMAGEISPPELGLWDIKLFNQLIKRNYLILSMGAQMIYSFTFSLTILNIYAVTQFSFYNSIFFGIPWLIVTIPFCYYLSGNIISCFTYFYIVCFYVKLRAQQVSQVIQKATMENCPLTTVKRIVKIHNQLCACLAGYNKFWRKYFFATLFILLPCNLFMFHEVVYGHLNLVTRAVYILCVAETAVFIFMVTFNTAGASYEIHGTYTQLLSLYVKTIKQSYRSGNSIVPLLFKVNRAN